MNNVNNKQQPHHQPMPNVNILRASAASTFSSSTSFSFSLSTSIPGHVTPPHKLFNSYSQPTIVSSTYSPDPLTPSKILSVFSPDKVITAKFWHIFLKFEIFF